MACEIHPYLDAAFNFPSYALKLDVSRDAIKQFIGLIPSEYKKFLQTKIRNYLKTSSAKNIEYVFWCLLDHNKYKLSKMNICCTSQEIMINDEKIKETVKKMFDPEMYKLLKSYPINEWISILTQVDPGFFFAFSNKQEVFRNEISAMRG